MYGTSTPPEANSASVQRAEAAGCCCALACARPGCGHALRGEYGRSVAATATAHDTDRRWSIPGQRHAGACDSPTLRQRGQSQARAASDKRGGLQPGGARARHWLASRPPLPPCAKPPRAPFRSGDSAPPVPCRRKVFGTGWAAALASSASGSCLHAHCTVSESSGTGTGSRLPQLTCAISVSSPAKIQCPFPVAALCNLTRHRSAASCLPRTFTSCSSIPVHPSSSPSSSPSPSPFIPEQQHCLVLSSVSFLLDS
jgi:hypothetical protein